MSTPTAIEQWLARCGLSHLAPIFHANRIGLDVVQSLTDGDLKELGLAMGDRKRVLTAIAGAGQEAAPAQIPVERRQLTILFCDLAGSTALAARLDPEDMRDVIRAYQSACAAAITSHGGFVAKFMGDGVLAYFGYPRAHEDEAERAVQAALDIVDSVGSLATAAEAPLQVRIGVATGLVVVGDLIGEGAAAEQAVVGETPNLAARLQALAEPFGIVIAETTRRHVGGLFELADLGPQALKGFAVPQPAWRVLGASRVANRFRALRSGTAPLVGRDAEVELLMRHWDAAKAGHGRAVLISAEAGVGKSRLAETIRERVRSEPHFALRYFCSPHHRESAFHPVIGQLERAASFDRSDDVPTKRRKLAELLAGSPVQAELPLLAELLSLPGAEDWPTPPLTPEQRKRKIVDTLLLLLEYLASRSPVLMIFEDLHWMDPTSGELTERALAGLDRLPLLLIATFRPDFQPPWVSRPNVSTITLPRLDRGAQEALVRGLAGDVALPTHVLGEILDRSDGVPLFLEELTKDVLEAGETARAVPPAGAKPAVPISLQTALMARLDRLGPVAREVAQTASAIGREFAYDLVVAGVARDEREARSGLDQLVAAGLVFQYGNPPDAVYQFKHSLVRDVAYSTLLRGLRQTLHGRLADHLERRMHDKRDSQPEMLAYHLAEAGFPERAASYWLEAGRREAGRSANLEAIAHLRRGIAALSTLPETSERLKLELALQLALGPSLLGNQGFKSSELDTAYLRARAIAERLGDDRALFTATWGRWITTSQDCMLGSAMDDLIAELFCAADAIGDPGLCLQAHHAGWVRTLWLGQPLATHRHVTSGLELYDPGKHAGHAVLYGGHDPAACGCGYDAIALWILGWPDQAVARARQGIALATDLGHASSLAHALWLAGFVHQMRRDAQAALETSERLVALSNEHDSAVYRVASQVLQGWARALHGAPESEGLAEMRAGVEAYRSLAGVMVGPFLVSLADSERRAHHFDRAEATLVDAERVIRQRGERLWVGGVLRSKGDLAASRPSPDFVAAEHHYGEALAIARQVGSKSLELRAARGLARVWHRRRQTKEAHDLLAPILGWFTEGFDTLDLIETKALLETLR